VALRDEGRAAPVLELDGVGIRYGRTQVVSDASFQVAAGEFVTLLGPSGSGKTSLLRAIAGFVTPAAGQVRLHGVRMDNVPAYERDIGMVFQNYALFPHMTVAQNLSFGPRMTRTPKKEIEARVAETLAQVRLSEYRDRYPHELSGGQQQRVAIARALAIRPSVLLLDEPMSNLDARLRAQMRVDLIALLKGLGVTAVSVTHNQEEALAMSDRIIVMAEGKVRQIGSPGDIYRNPADPFVADFVGDANVIRAKFAANEGDLARFETEWGQAIHALAASPLISSAALLLIRPESISIVRTAQGARGEGTNRVCGKVSHRAYMGAFVEIRIAAGSQDFLVKQPVGPGYAELAVGDTVEMHWDPATVVALRQG
jgi:ABC-type Fe3+/spermidine/putrescine transport system ATPase subunit